MSKALWPRGLMTAMVTPLSGDGLDSTGIRGLVEQQVDAGVNGVVVSGGTGEHGALTLEERRQLFEQVASASAGRLPFVAQTGALATRDAVALSQYAEGLGALGLLLPSPYGEHVTWRERVAFYESVSGAVTVPIMLYNTPTAGVLGLAEIELLSQMPGISAVKQSSTDVNLLGDLLAWAATSDFAVYVGEDSLLVPGVLAGAHGGVLGTGNIIPAELVTVLALCRDQGLTDELRRAWGPVRRFLRFMEQSENYVAMCKLGLRLRGLDVGDVRPPYLMPQDQEASALADELKALDAAFGS